MMDTLILVSGLPGAGKTTVAKKLAYRLGDQAIHFDIDDIKRGVVVDSVALENDIDPDEIRWVYYQEALNLTHRTFEEGVYNCVIMDEVFHSKELRTRISDWCICQGVQSQWVVVQCSYEVIERRLNSNPRDGHILTAEQCLKLNRRFEELFDEFTIEESVTVINSDGKHVSNFDMSKIRQSKVPPL
ncbi:AAA family ATPase [Candidatus Parcubacteria bacterium]|jgi:predicted kinase|nr:AAA family ATPase [Candidatus Parcubacteria bacterium]